MQVDQAGRFMLTKLKKELSPALTYHNAAHTEDVYQAAGQLATQEGVTGPDLDILLTAALFHDSGFLVAADGHETFSCDIARQELPALGYTPEEIEEICDLIMATSIPQKPRTRLERILCDADLDYLGRPDFFERSLLLYEEMRHLGMVGSREEFEQKQLEFLKNHRYFTAASEKKRAPIQEKNLNILQSNSPYNE